MKRVWPDVAAQTIRAIGLYLASLGNSYVRNYLRKRLWQNLRHIPVHSPHNTARVMNAHSDPISAQAPFIVPFSRDNSFVGREELLADIDVTKNGFHCIEGRLLLGLEAWGKRPQISRGFWANRPLKKASQTAENGGQIAFN